MAIRLTGTNTLKTNKNSRKTQVARKSIVARPGGRNVLRLFVAGATDRSRQAVLRVRQLCETDPGGAWKLEVIDIYQQPALARFNQIVATPTLIKEFPRPVRRFIGSMANITGLFVELDLITKGNRSGTRVRGSGFRKSSTLFCKNFKDVGHYIPKRPAIHLTPEPLSPE